MGHCSFKSYRKITGPALHHPLILLTSNVGYSILTAHTERETERKKRRKENDCISEGFKRVAMDGREE